MTKQNEMAKDNALSEILGAVSEQNALTILAEKVKEICQKYFPNADEVFENTMIDFAYSVQNFNFARKLIHTEINRYEKIKGGKNHEKKSN